MRAAGIVAEYNPFHNGHAYLARRAIEAGADCVVAVMSGNFVQRGEPAIFDFSARVKAALLCGVDLVIQLPSIYAVSGAQSFAGAGVELLDALGCVDTLVFGSECGDTARIAEAAGLLASPEFPSLLKEELAHGVSFASARESALRHISPASADLIASPNDILAVEYVSALERIGSRMKPLAVGRVGAGHDSAEIADGFAGASKIRELIRSGGDISGLVPAAAEEIYRGAEQADISRIERAILYKMRTVGAQELASAPDISEGIENRILTAAREARSLEELYTLAKTKRYSHARIRRIILNCFLGVTAELAAIDSPYIRVGGFTPRGAELLREAALSARLPILAKTADIAALSEEAKAVFAAECRAGDIYALCLTNAAECGAEKRFRPIIVK
jgi:predicted nucleotidyltransferase